MNDNMSKTSGEVDVTALLPVTDAELTQLHARLAAGAEERGLLDVAYRTIDTPLGELLLAATDKGLVRVAFEREGFDHVLDMLAKKVSPRVLNESHRLDVVARELEEYFAGTRQAFDISLDHTLSSGFGQVVQRHLPHISYGHTQSYQEVAQFVGSPKAARAVGTACATNPLPIIVPCHRVLRTDGNLGGYLGGPEAKQMLLSLEQAA